MIRIPGSEIGMRSVETIQKMSATLRCLDISNCTGIPQQILLVSDNWQNLKEFRGSGIMDDFTVVQLQACKALSIVDLSDNNV